MPSLLLAIELCAAITACGGRLPPSGGVSVAPWREVESEHFRLRTDSGSQDAKATVNELERFRSGLLAIFHAPDDLDTGQLPVVVLDNGWTDIADRQVEGFYVQALFQPWIILRSGRGLAQQELIKHEIVHFLTTKIIPQQPPWLAEGLATFFETVDENLERDAITVGRPPNQRLRAAQLGGLMSVKDLFATRVISHDTPAFYSSAWAVVHHLMNHHPTAFLSYQRELSLGRSHDEAWQSSFPQLSADDLDAAVRTYLDGGQYELLTYRVPARHEAATRERALPEADRHSTQALLVLVGHRASKGRTLRSWDEEEVRTQARLEIDQALALEPWHAPSLALAHFELGVPLDARVEQAKKHNPHDWLTTLLWVEWLGRQGRGAEQQKAMEELEKLVGEDPSLEVRLRRPRP